MNRVRGMTLFLLAAVAAVSPWLIVGAFQVPPPAAPHLNQGLASLPGVGRLVVSPPVSLSPMAKGRNWEEEEGGEGLGRRERARAFLDKVFNGGVKRTVSSLLRRRESGSEDSEEEEKEEPVDPAEIKAREAYMQAMRSSEKGMERIVSLERKLEEERQRGEALARAAEVASRKAKELELVASDAQMSLKQVKSLPGRLKELEEKLQVSQQSVKELEKDLDQSRALQKKIEKQLAQTSDSAEARIQELESKLSRMSEDSKDKIRREVVAKTMELEGALVEAAEARQIATRLQSEVDSQKQEALILSATLTEARKSEEATQESLREALGELERRERDAALQIDDSKLQKEIRDLELLMEKSRASNKEKLEKAEAEIVALQERADRVADYDQVAAAKDDLESKLEAMTRETNQRLSDLDKITRERDEALKLRESVVNDLEEARQQLSKALPWAERGPALEEEVEKMKAEADAFRAQAEDLDRRMVELTRLEETLKETNFNMERELETSNWSGKALKRQNEALQGLSERNRQRYVKSIASLNEKVEILEEKLEEYSTLQDSFAKERAAREEAEKFLNSEREAKTKLSLELTSVQESLAKAVGAKKMAETALKLMGGVSATQRIGELEARLEREEQQKNELQIKADDLQGEVGRLEESLGDKEAKLRLAEERALESAVNLENRIELLEGQLAESRATLESAEIAARHEEELARKTVDELKKELEEAQKQLSAQTHRVQAEKDQIQKAAAQSEYEARAAANAAEERLSLLQKELAREVEAGRQRSEALKAAESKMLALEEAARRKIKRQQESKLSSLTHGSGALREEGKEEATSHRASEGDSSEDLPYKPPS